MEDQAIGWIAAIIIGGIAGWLAEQFMQSRTGHHWRPIRSLTPLSCAFLRGCHALDGDRHALESAQSEKHSDARK
jgi:hypothetical protein